MPDDPNGNPEVRSPAATAPDPPVAQEQPADNSIVAGSAEIATRPTAAELVLDIRTSATALAQMGFAEARARLARFVPRTRSKELLNTMTTGIETAVTRGKGVTRKAGSVIKETAQNPETQEIAFMGAAAAAREAGLMMAGSVGGRIVDRITERLGERLLRNRTAGSGDEPPSAKAGPGSEADNQTD